ncbi:hypothetical protein O6H91_08G079400 [Diphasiastrum complanatum]|uniref:Uncharacterized protein n=1 Tax=Diphasiastrum complanatum TaxID=34168 RepID=A0ACC2CZ39_DIPCM|nr:hypothetical protein O6H91_08G079400 [Diphasiastrum complanatum]
MAEGRLVLILVLGFVACTRIGRAVAAPSPAGSSLLELEIFIGRMRSQLPHPSTQLQAARGVLARLLPQHVSSFDFSIISLDQCGGKACFQIENYQRTSGEFVSEEISIKGTTGVELCAGLHWYLKNWCKVHISWEKTGGSQLMTVPKPGSLPKVGDGGVLIQRPVPWNYYQNTVTSSYSFVWWNWTRWEKEIDWMALQGINLPLAFTGQEAIWEKVFQSEKFNLTKEDLDDYFGGPAFLAWARMGNLHRWGGPLPQTWLDNQLKLQHSILQRMRALGMTPVLPSFSGNVPGALHKLYPSAKISRLKNWNTVNGDPRWCCTFLLDPTDPLFVDIGKAFVEEQIQEYGGTHHIYNCDTFNENLPPTNAPSYIKSLGEAVYAAMSAGDPDAIWLMQGWLFSSQASFWQPPQMKALLHSVPVGRMVVLDLFADVDPVWSQSNHFYGTPYIWCMLHNFGGNTEMYGRLDAVRLGPIEARESENSTMVGVGMCMEGIEQNPVAYELMAEMAFRGERTNLEIWIDDYATRRYGEVAEGAHEAWELLYRTIYNCSDGIADHNTDVIVKFPDVDPSTVKKVPGIIKNRMTISEPDRRLLEGSFFQSKMAGHIWYPPSAAIKALRSFLNSAHKLAKVPQYRYDVVDLTRQVLSKHANELYAQILTSFRHGNLTEVRKNSKTFLELISDLDSLLLSNEGFLLGPWLESAKELATTETELKLYEWNARTQITMWYDNTQDMPSSLHDYANKMWSGLLRDYYLPRASLYMTLLQDALEKNVSFPFSNWRVKWISLTNSWQNEQKLYEVQSKGDSISISKAVFSKYCSRESM